MSDKDRFFLPTSGSALSAYRAFRAWAEGEAATRGKKLDPAWYLDGPEDLPELYDDRPTRLSNDSAGFGGPQEQPAGLGRLREATGANDGGEGTSGGLRTALPEVAELTGDRRWHE